MQLDKISQPRVPGIRDGKSSTAYSQWVSSSPETLFQASVAAEILSCSNVLGFHGHSKSRAH